MAKTVKLLTVKETTNFFDCTSTTIYNMINDGRLTSYRKGSGKSGDKHFVTLSSIIDQLK